MKPTLSGYGRKTVFFSLVGVGALVRYFFPESEIGIFILIIGGGLFLEWVQENISATVRGWIESSREKVSSQIKELGEQIQGLRTEIATLGKGISETEAKTEDLGEEIQRFLKEVEKGAPLHADNLKHFDVENHRARDHVEGPHYYRAKEHFVEDVREGVGEESETVAQMIRSELEEGGAYATELRRLLFTVETESVIPFEQSKSATLRSQEGVFLPDLAAIRRERFEALKNLLLPAQK